MDYWQIILNKLEDKVHPHTFSKLSKATFQVDFSKDILTISVPNEKLRNELNANYFSFIKEAMQEAGLSEININYIVANGENLSPFYKLSIPINPLYNFDNFIIGSSNSTAHAACLAVANSINNAYNPLYIYGGVGLGKTHLISAIGNSTKGKKKLEVLFTNADKFMTAIVQHIKNQQLNELRESFLKCDILLMDDVQFLIGKEKTQEELFLLFDELYSQKKQIVFTSDCPPKDLHIEERLKSRFQWGLTVDIQPPDLETKIAILHQKAHLRNYNLPNDIALYIASNVKSNIRELEGALIKLLAVSSIKSCKITLDFAKSILKDLFPEEEKIVTPDEIIKSVAKYFNIKTKTLSSKTNERTIVIPRQIAMFLCKKLTRYSLVEIGHVFNKNHATVIYSIKKTESQLQTDPIFKQQIDKIIKQLK